MSHCLLDDFEKYISREYKSVIVSISKFAEKLKVKIFLIGGIVRDLILKTPIKDVDITVQGDAVLFCKKLEKEFDCKIIAVQEHLKTAKVLFKSGVVIDFASTREEFYSLAGHLPIVKNFGCNLHCDVKRRDFTINTLALELTGDNKFFLIDYFNGYNDIKKKTVRILHNESFIDDPSRIVRAVKFQMRLGFNIEKNTSDLMSKYLENVDKSIPLERIKSEFKQYFSISKDDIYKNIIEKKVYKLICDRPFTSFDNSDINIFKEYIDIDNIWLIYFCLLLINSNFDEIRLNLKKEEKKIIEETKKLILSPQININDNFQIYNSFIKRPEVSIILYYIITKDKSVIKYLKSLRNIKIIINGEDLLNIGFTPSKYFREIFQEILREKLNGKLQTKEEEIKFAKKFLNTAG